MSILARLDRDRPDLAAKVRAFEMTGAEALRAAGLGGRTVKGPRTAAEFLRALKASALTAAQLRKLAVHVRKLAANR